MLCSTKHKHEAYIHAYALTTTSIYCLPLYLVGWEPNAATFENVLRYVIPTVIVLLWVGVLVHSS